MPPEARLPPLSAVAELTEAACQLVRAMLQRPVGKRQKSDESPVTEIDMAVDAFLHRELLGLMPLSGWLSEETADRPDRLQQDWVWVVDPIDGTRSLLAGEPEFVVSVALVGPDGLPQLAVVANPSTGEVFSAEHGKGARDRDGQLLRAKLAFDPQDWCMLVSRNEVAAGLWRDCVPVANQRPMGSLAYKMALVAAGAYDGHATNGPRSEWDAAAGALLISEAGGICSDAHGRPLRFNRPRPRFDGCVAASTPAYPVFAKLGERSRRGPSGGWA